MKKFLITLGMVLILTGSVFAGGIDKGFIGGSQQNLPKLNVNATLGTELLPWTATSFTPVTVTWTMTTTGPLTHVTGNTTAVTGTVTGTLTAGVTYAVAFTGTGGGDTATYTLGGVTGTTIAASGAISFTDYITATADSELVITPTNTCTVAFTLISVKALTNAMGDLTVQGNLNVYSPAYFYSRIYGNPANGVLSLGRMTLSDNANDNGIVFGSLGTATKGIDLSSSGLGSGDYFLYLNSTNFWNGVGTIQATQFNVDLLSSATLTDLHIFPYSYANLSLGADSNSAVLIASAEAGTYDRVGYTSVTFPTANKDYANKAGMGTASAVGEMLQVTGGTNATAGFYRIITIVGTGSVQVDRAIHADTADITDGTVTIDKDIIGMFATDGTNGQRIMNYSAQNKPLQLGGDVLVATSGLTSEDVTLGGVLDVDVSAGTARIQQYKTIYISAASMTSTATNGAVLGTYEYATN